MLYRLLVKTNSQLVHGVCDFSENLTKWMVATRKYQEIYELGLKCKRSIKSEQKKIHICM